MRKLVVCNIVSLDGFYSGQGGNLATMPFDTGFSEYNAERLRSADTLLLGRSTFEMFRSYWPTVAQDAKQPQIEREISLLNSAIEKVVVSNGLVSNTAQGWGPTRVVSRNNARNEVINLKNQVGKDILIFGSHQLWSDLLSEGLVDELHLMIGAGVITEGIRAFEDRPNCRLRLIGSRTFKESSLLLAQYGVEY